MLKTKGIINIIKKSKVIYCYALAQSLSEVPGKTKEDRQRVINN